MPSLWPRLTLGPGGFECIGQGRSAWCRKVERSCTLIQNTKEAPPWNLCITSDSQAEDQLLREGPQQWRGFRRRIASRPPPCPGPVDENTSAAVESSDGSDGVHSATALIRR